MACSQVRILRTNFVQYASMKKAHGEHQDAGGAVEESAMCFSAELMDKMAHQGAPWALVDRAGKHFKLPPTMIFLGREECDIKIQSRSVDKRHAVLNYDHYEQRFKVKDLSSLNGTFVNDIRIPEQEYVTLEPQDTLRFGYDPMVYRMERIEEVPHLEQLETPMSPTKEMPAWAVRERAPGMAECQGCIAEQAIRHTCGIHEEHTHPHDAGCHQVALMENGHGHVPHRMSPAQPNAQPEGAANHVWQNNPHYIHSPEHTCQHQKIDGEANYIYQGMEQRQYPPNQDWQPYPHSQDPRTMHAHAEYYAANYANVSMSDNSGSVPLSVPVPPGAIYTYHEDPNAPVSSRVIHVHAYPNQPHVENLQKTYRPPPPTHIDSPQRLRGSPRTCTESPQYVTGLPPTPQQDHQQKTPERISPTKVPGSPPIVRQDKRRSLTGTEKELETVMKGTPLYGQPAWWGEVEGDQYSYPHTSTLSNIKPASNGKLDSEQKSLDRPATLPLDQKANGDADSPNNKSVTETKSMTEERFVYMEIPQKDVNPVKDGDKSPPSLQTPPERDDAGFNSTGDSANLNMSGTAFTVDLGDEEENSIGASKVGTQSLSDFLPSKIRRSFRARSASKKESSKGKEKDADVPRKEDGSPMRQKSEEKWMMGARRQARQSTVQHSGYHSDGHHSAVSSDNDEVSIQSDIVTTKGKKSGQPSKTPGVSRSGSVKKKAVTRRDSGPKKDTKPPRSTTRPTRSGSEKTKATSDPGTFLINKMLSSKKKDSRGPKQPQAAEFERSSETRTSITHTSSTVHSSSSKKLLSVPKPKKSARRSGKSGQKDDDNVSESGTYTIEGETNDKEIQEARKSIDKVFGVMDSADEMDENFNNILDEENGDEVGEAYAKPGGDSLDTAAESSTYREEEEYKPDPVKGLPADAPKWVSQWAALAGTKGVSVSKSGDVAVKGKESAELRTEGEQSPDSAASKRNRPGTGRKLPTPPVSKSSPSTPVTTTPKTSMDLMSPRSGGDMVSPTSDFTARRDDNATVISDIFHSAGDGRSAAHSKHLVSDVMSRSLDADTDISMLRASPRSPRSPHSPQFTSRTNFSMDTQLLLRDTEHVMNAMAERMRRAKSNSPVGGHYELSLPVRDGDESDSENSSAAILDQTPRRQKLMNKDCSAGSNSSKPPRPSSGKEGRVKSRTSSTGSSSEKLPRPVGRARRMSSEEFEDRLSESDMHSETSTDMSELSPKLGRKGSGGKGTISVTRVNRAFALRRARLEGEETPRSSVASDASSAATGGSRSRPGSANKDRIRPRPASASGKESARTDASLGTQIQKRSQEIARGKPTVPLTRSDGGRYSMRATKSTSVTTSSTNKPADRKKDTQPKRKTSTGTGLCVTGNRSQPSSRSNSPRSQEYSAWKRRKDYDPRKAAAAGKVKAKETKSTKTDGQSDPRLMRSKSYSNTENWAQRVRSDTFVSDYSEYDDVPVRNVDIGYVELDSTRTTEVSRVNGTDSDRLGSVSTPESAQSYDSLILASVYQLSLKLKTATDRLMDKMREKHHLSGSPSPVDDLLNQPFSSDIPGWKSANPELAGILKNLRKTEHHLQVIDRALFPSKDGGPNTSPPGTSDHQQYLKELERIRSEIAGFKPIDRPSAMKPWAQKQTSYDSQTSDPLGGDEFY